MKKILFTCLLMVLSISFVVAQTAVNQTDSKGKKQGAWEEKTPTGTLKGAYADDQKEGCWTTYAADGKLLRIEHFNMGLREGIAIDIDQRGYLVSETYFVNNLIEGAAKKYYYGTNPASTIDYIHGKISGKKKIYYENSAGKIQEESDYKDDIKNGPSNYFTMTGDPVAEYNYVNGKLQGIQKAYYPAKKLMSEQEFVENVENGFVKEYYENGNMKSEGIYVKGKLHGVWKDYNEDGKVVAMGNYVNDLKEGKWEEYNAEGKVIKTTKYLNGVAK